MWSQGRKSSRFMISYFKRWKKTFPFQQRSRCLSEDVMGLKSLPVGAMINCADNTGGKNLFILSAKGTKGLLITLPAAGVGDMVMVTIKEGKPELRKKGHPIRQWKSYQRQDGTFLNFEDNAGVTVNNKGEMEGSAIRRPIAKECVDLWPRIASMLAALRESPVYL